MKTDLSRKRIMVFFTVAIAFLFLQGMGQAAEEKISEQDNKRMGLPPGVDPIHKTYIPVTGDYEAARAMDIKDKSKFEKRQQNLLEERYDLSDRASKVMMSAGKRPVQEGVRVKLPEGMTWEKL